MRLFAVRILIASTWMAAVPALAGAQSSIAGTVNDTSGALLPGVTVEASSPALIEQTRSAVTNNAGQFRIIELRPGTYTVTFTLPGFIVLRREGIELTADFTAPVNAELQVGAIEESITVTGESPIVDTQNITQRTVMTREVLDVIPSGRNIQAVGIMIPGTNLSFGGGAALSRDVGGSGGLQQSPLIFRGSADAVQTVDGMRLNNLCANGAYSGVYWNDGSFQELSYVTGADSADMAQGGIRINMIPKDGGNTFRGTMVGNYTTGSWQADNLRDNLSGDLTANPGNRITNVSVIKKIWDINPSFGGPIVRNRAWFNATFRHWGVEKTTADSFFDADPAPYRYLADTSRPGIDDGHIVSRVGRLTWQVSQKDKLSYYHDDQNKYRNHWGISALISPEASAIQVTPTSFVSVAKWTRTQTNRLFLDFGFAMYNQEYTELYQPEVTGVQDKVWDDAAIAASRVYAITEQTNGRVFAAWPAPADHFSILRQYAASASYVTGAHAFKIGGTLGEGPRRTVERYTGDLTMTFNNGLPQAVTLRTPLDQREGIKADIGLYVQDKWTIKRATINAGLRFDWFRGEVLDEDLPAGRWSPAAHFDGFQVQNWKDINPRIGIAYDLFGDGKTAVKASVARYVNGEMVGTAAANNPQTTVGRTDVRIWRDLNGDFTIFNSDGSVQAAELGPSTNANFGRLISSTTTTDPEVLNGWHVRPYNWEYAVSVQHQLLPRIGLSASYGRRSFGNQTTIDNQLTDPNSYDGPFCITAPSNPNLPGGGGYPVCGLYDIKPTFLGRVQNIRRLVSHYGRITDVSSGFEVNLNARPWPGTFIQGGIAASTRHFNTCDAPLVQATPGIAAGAFAVATSNVDNPEGQGCDQTFPYRPDVKILGSHGLPWDISISGTYQFSRGVQNPVQPSVVADWAVPNALIAPALGRNLAAGATATKTVRLIQPGTVYGDQNLHQLDLRASKRFRFGRYSFRVDADLYNAFNSNWPYTVNTTFTTAASSRWLRPTNVLQGRFFKLGGQFSF
ncbi:MAG: carboxypeptidase regulatory-like domain-containing protein [Vicinamibacterales bacterium]